jgi:hypothetical protein
VHQRTTPFFGMAKVSENFIPQNFEKKIFAIFSTAVGNLNFIISLCAAIADYYNSIYTF